MNPNDSEINRFYERIEPHIRFSRVWPKKPSVSMNVGKT